MVLKLLRNILNKFKFKSQMTGCALHQASVDSLVPLHTPDWHVLPKSQVFVQALPFFSSSYPHESV